MVPATRESKVDTDVADPLSPSHQSFVDPTGEVRVSVWEVSLDTVAAYFRVRRLKDTAYRLCVESVDYVLAWVGDYCEAWASSHRATGSRIAPSSCAWRRGIVIPACWCRSRPR